MNRPITPSAEEFLARLNAAVDAYLGRTKGQRPQGTKAWLAQQLGCDRTTLYKYLDGTNRIPPDTLRALMSLIGVPENEAYTLLFLGGYGVAAPVAPSPPQREGAISATGLRAALAEDLGADLGAELASPLSLLAGLLVDSAKGHLARDDAEQALAADPDLARLARVLAGREIPAGGAVVSFGTGAQTGDIRMRDLAGRDLVRLAVRANAIYINHFHAGSQAFFGSDAPVAPAPASAPSAQQRAAPAPNPFGRVGRIDNPDEFFDREHLLERIFFELARGINLSLVGEAQIGKSSILAKLCHEGLS